MLFKSVEHIVSDGPFPQKNLQAKFQRGDQRMGGTWWEIIKKDTKLVSLMERKLCFKIRNEAGRVNSGKRAEHLV